MPNTSQRGFTSLFLVLFLIFILVTAYFLWTRKPLEKPIVENFTEVVKEPEKISYMFLAVSDSGTLTKVPGTEQFRLVLTNPNKIIYFSDKPEKKTGNFQIGFFIKSWGVFGFNGATPAKAALTIDGVLNNVNEKSTDTLLVSLTDPVFDIRKDTLEFIVEPLPENPGGGLKEFIAVNKQSLSPSEIKQSLISGENNNFPVRFRGPKLFIDNGQTVVGESYDIENFPADSEETVSRRIHPIPLSSLRDAKNSAEASSSAMPDSSNTFVSSPR